MSRTFAYCRVSRPDQCAQNQVRDIMAAGFNVEHHRIVTEAISGSVPAFQRPLFAKLADRLEIYDVVAVTKLDRLGRNAIDVRQTVDRLAAMGVRVHCLALGGADLASAAGRMTMGVIASMAEFEIELLRERTSAGLRRAVAEGRVLGRPPALTHAEQDAVRDQRRNGASLGALAKKYGVSRSAIQRAEKRSSEHTA